MSVDLNTHSSFKDKIYMSNLCQEITLPTKPIDHIDDKDGVMEYANGDCYKGEFL